MEDRWRSQGREESDYTNSNLFQGGGTSPGGRPRGSLGTLIERSTSAPPASSAEELGKPEGDDSLIGQDLLQHMSVGFPDYIEARAERATPAVRNGLHSQSSASLGDDLFLGGSAVASHSLGQSGTPSSTYDRMRPMTATSVSSGRSYDYPSGNQFPGGIAPSGGLIRSQSAQPAVHSDHRSAVGFPPGLSRPSQNQGRFPDVAGITSMSSTELNSGMERAASTGVIGSHDAEALRPSARTLTDLIQDDYPNRRQRGDSFDAAGLLMERHSASPAIPRPPARGDSRGYSSPSNQSYGSRDRGDSLRRQEYRINEHEYYEQSPVEPNRPTEIYRQQHLHPQRQQFPDIRRRLSPMEDAALGLYQPQQQSYYGDHPPGVNLHHQQGAQPNQPVYVNAPAPQGRHGAYSNVRQETQVVHRSLDPVGPNESFISVIPVQTGAPQMAYWQSEQPQTYPSGMTVLHHQRHHRTPHQQYDPNEYGGRRNEKSGRGRRGGRRGDSKAGGAHHTVGSPLLEEFRSARVRDWTIMHIRGHVVEFCQDQNGSRFIQQRLEMGDPNEQEVVLSEVVPSIRRLRNDVFGNYVVQKLLDFGTYDMKEEIRKTLEGEMLQLSLQMYGCRVVQKALEAVNEQALPLMLQEFHHNVLSCIHDQNGNHVIQKCIEVLFTRAKKAEAAGEPDRAVHLRNQVAFMIEDILNNTAGLSCHPYGCRVLQRILEHCDEDRKTDALDEIRKCHRRLLDDQYGNYVIQHVLQFGRTSDRDSILEIVAQNGLLELSRQKFASNVVEKLLKYGNSQQRQAIAREMLKSAEPLMPGDAGKSVVLLMVRDAYANYVVQTTLDVVPESREKQLLLQELNSHAEELKNYTFAKHIVTKMSILNSKQ